jgi:hypothetical protein
MNYLGFIPTHRKKIVRRTLAGWIAEAASWQPLTAGRLRIGVVFPRVGMPFQIPEQDYAYPAAASNPVSIRPTKQFTGLLIHIIRIIDLIITDYAV